MKIDVPRKVSSISNQIVFHKLEAKLPHVRISDSGKYITIYQKSAIAGLQKGDEYLDVILGFHMGTFQSLIDSITEIFYLN